MLADIGKAGPRLWTAFAMLLMASVWAGAQNPEKRSGRKSMAVSTGSAVQVSGQVTTPHGDPLPGAEVTIEPLGHGKQSQTVSAGPHGQFEAHVPGVTSVPLTVTLTASLSGYTAAQESIEVDEGQSADPVGLVLRKLLPDPDLPDFEALCDSMLPKLRAPASGQPASGVPLQHLELALRLLDRGSPEDAAPPLAEVARQNPGCVECGTLAGLAELETGAWSSAASHLQRAAHAAVMAHDRGRMPEPLIVLGDLQLWRGEFSKAAVFFLDALSIQPNQPLALQELGRTFMLERKMTVADGYFERALAHGADPESHLLRAQTLIELDDPQKAREQLDAYLGGRKLKDVGQEPRRLWELLSNRIALESRPGGATLVDRAPEELAAATPELKDLTPLTDRPAIEPLLTKIGQGVEAIFKDFPNTSAEEEIEMQRLHGDGKVAEKLKQEFRYLLLSSSDGNSLSLKEYRTDRSGKAALPGVAESDFIVTSGFASIPLIFHPQYQEGSSFRLLGRQEIDGRYAWVVAFAERPATAKMLEDFVLKDQRATVLTQGFAWIDPDTFQVLRMHTDLLKPLPDVRLTAQATDVHYGPVHFKSKDQTLWLPQDVTVTVHWNGRVYRNQHHYADYQLFQVGTHERIKAPKVPAVPAEP